MRNIFALLTAAVFPGGQVDAEELAASNDDLKQGFPVYDDEAIDKAVADHSQAIRRNPNDAAA